MSIVASARNLVRRSLLTADAARDPRLRPWGPSRRLSESGSVQRVCNICGWQGSAFAGPPHSEMANCPSCGSIARDRFLHWSWTRTTPYSRSAAVLETSPRMNEQYRQHMAKIVDYTASDYDESAHKAMIRLDLQNIELPDRSVDVVLTPHVLEHVPDTEKALGELFRITRPGGVVVLMIPMPQGVTAPPVTPEYHGDNTLVFWRFGWDLRDKIEAAGFTVRCLATQPLIDRVRRGEFDTGWTDSSLDEVSLLSACDPDRLTPIADERQARRYGFEPDVHFITWLAERPSAG